MKLEKNYYRSELVKLFQDHNFSPLLFTGKYKHTASEQWVTLTNIRHFIPDQKKQLTICDHINLDKASIPPSIHLNNELHNRRFCFYAELYFYHYYDENRAGMKLVQLDHQQYIWQKLQNQSQNFEIAYQILKHGQKN